MHLAAAMLEYVGHMLFFGLSERWPPSAPENARPTVFGAELLRNGHVARGVRAALVDAATAVEERYPRPAATRSAEEVDALARFRGEATVYSERFEEIESDPGRLASAGDVAKQVDQVLRRMTFAAPPEVSVFVRLQFPPLFVQAFVEKDLRRDPEVRSAVVQGMLGTAGSWGPRGSAELERVIDDRRGIRAGLARIQAAHAAVSADQARQFDRLTASLGVVNTLQSVTEADTPPEVLVHGRFLGEGRRRGYVAVRDRTGRLLARYPIRTGIIALGRAENNAIQLMDPTVSSRHATIRLQPGSVVVVDEGSTNGTLLNGVRIQEPAEIGFGAPVRIGEYLVEVLEAEAFE